MDETLPAGGFRSGTLVEWLSAGDGGGATTLALLAAREASRQGGTLLVVDGRGEFYPPAAARMGIDLSRLVVVHVLNRTDQYWAMDQSLRCPAVAAVLAWPDAVDGKLDGRTFRRLQLAAETGGSLGLLVRPEAARHQPSWAEVRLLVETAGFRVQGSGFRVQDVGCDKPVGCDKRSAVAPTDCKLQIANCKLQIENAGERNSLVSCLLSSDSLSTRCDCAALVTPYNSRWLKLSLLRCRGGIEGRSVQVEIDDETHSVSMAAQLASPAAEGAEGRGQGAGN